MKLDQKIFLALMESKRRQGDLKGMMQHLNQMKSKGMPLDSTACSILLEGFGTVFKE
jgi:hypothetical protein